MTYGKIKQRLVASALAATLAPAMAFGGAFLGTSTDAQAAPKSGTCQAYAVLASKEGDGTIPKNLEFMKEWLTDEPYDRYKSFHLIDKKTFKLELGKEASTKFKTGHSMRLKLLGGESKALKYHLHLTHADGKKKLVSMDYSIENNGLMFVQGGEHTSGEISGKILWATHCTHKNG